ncbi:hypothetical protein LCGC14_1754950 [marine sediment metagenome]|uniref:Uncharacterized protein n=1 Tax=marine sediment metagenome TaxID=412755 RepID=A0A0F9JHY0_9ZZZZ
MAHCQNTNGTKQCPNPADREYTDRKGKVWRLCEYCYITTLRLTERFGGKEANR